MKFEAGGRPAILRIAMFVKEPDEHLKGINMR